MGPKKRSREEKAGKIKPDLLNNNNNNSSRDGVIPSDMKHLPSDSFADDGDLLANAAKGGKY